MFRKESHHLLRNHNHRLYGEFPVAMIEEIFQAWSQQVDNKDIVQTLLTEVINVWDSGCPIVRYKGRMERRLTYGIQLRSCMFGIHRVVGVHHFF